jgi:hypothetical protein
MMEHFFKTVPTYLPLNIQAATWENPQFNIHGKGWYFNLVGEWRIIDSEKILVACDDKDAYSYIAKLIGLQIIGVQPLSGKPYLDPVFLLSDGTKLEVFSNQPLEPWRFRVFNDDSDETIVFYIADPYNPDHSK